MNANWHDIEISIINYYYYVIINSVTFYSIIFGGLCIMDQFHVFIFRKVVLQPIQHAN